MAHAPDSTLSQSPRPPLEHARVLVVGLGGLGVPAATMLGAAGIGYVTLIDPDPVTLSNLHRQLLYCESDLGKPKALVGAWRLGARFPKTHFLPLVAQLNDHNARELLLQHDFVIDATDRWSTKLWLHQQALQYRRPLAHAGAVGWRGQALTILPGVPGCLYCLLGDPTGPDDPSCQEAGIVPGVVQALGVRLGIEAVSWLHGRDSSLLLQRFLYVDASRGLARVRPFAPDPRCPFCDVSRDALLCA